MNRFFFTVISLVAVTTISCGVRLPWASDTRTCDEIADVALRSLLQEAHSPEALKQHMSITYVVPLDKIESAVNDDGSGYVVAIRNDIVHSIVTQDSRPISARLLFNSRPPSAQKVVQCLGTPQWYWAYYSFGPTGADHGLSLDMYLPASGVAAYAMTYGHTKEPPPLDQNIPVLFIDFVVPSTDEKMTMNDLMRERSPEFREEIKRQLKPWPSDWRDLQVEVDPALR